MLGVFLHILYVPVCIFLVLVVLLQTGKRADLAGAFGGGGSQTAFGARGAATFLTKLTTVAAVLFMIIALGLSIISSRQEGSGGSVLDSVPVETNAPAPADPLLPAPTEPAAGEPTNDPAATGTDPEPTDTDADPAGDGSQP